MWYHFQTQQKKRRFNAETLKLIYWYYACQTQEKLFYNVDKASIESCFDYRYSFFYVIQLQKQFLGSSLRSKLGWHRPLELYCILSKLEGHNDSISFRQLNFTSFISKGSNKKCIIPRPTKVLTYYPFGVKWDDFFFFF